MNAATASKVPLPERLDGRRCLHVGTGDGFWAVEMERRGAAEVVALGPGDLVGLEPTRTGHFDLVLSDSLLGALRDPVRALERMRSVCAADLVVVEVIELASTLRHPRRAVARLDGEGGSWWQPNRAALLRMVESAGFVVEAATPVFFAPVEDDRPPVRRGGVPRRLVSPRGREELVAAVKGIPHVAVRARPA